ncbi:MAG: hypothetical protein WAM58_08155 [Candidatus Acidiferrum sp.]
MIAPLKRGIRVRFSHQAQTGPDMTVSDFTQDGMIELKEMAGQFAPHIFVLVEAIMLKGVNCTWVGEGAEASASGSCPFCAGDLHEAPTFWQDIDAIERGDYTWPTYKKEPPLPEWKPQPHPGFRAMWEWAKAQQRCFKHVMHLRNSYKKHTGIVVGIAP